MVKKAKVGGTPTLKNLSADELRVKLLAATASARDAIAPVRLLTQQRKWREALQAWADHGKLDVQVEVLVDEISRRGVKMSAWAWQR
mgnify:FL=1